MRLSLCIATYNEEANIHYPLDSAYDLVDEVIIVDGGSTDKTVAKAKSYGKKVKIFIEDNPPMFHINKQKAIERAKGEWILQLDADEELSNDLKQEIVKLLKGYIVKPPLMSPPLEGGEKGEVNHETIQQFNNKKVAFYFPRKNFFLTRFLTKGGQYPDYTIRLYRNGFARFPCRDVHENVEIISPVISNEVRDPNKISRSARNDKNAIGYFKNPILHYTDPDFSRYLKRWDRYTTLEAAQSVETVHEPSLHFINYFFIKPSWTFFSMYFRHLGFLDGFPGFVFALFSSIRFWAIYIKLWTSFKKDKAK